MTIRELIGKMLKHDNSNIDVCNIALYDSKSNLCIPYPLVEDEMLDEVVESYDIYLDDGEILMDIYI